MDKIYFLNTFEYIKHIVHKSISLHIRKIDNPLFIEKIQFLEGENRDENFIFQEILNHSFKTIKTIPATITEGSNLNLSTDSRFKYQIEKGPILIYLIWVDKDGHMIKPNNQDFIIMKEGEMFSIA